MKHKFLVIFLLTFVAVGIAGSADAQFWRKKSARRRHKSTEELSGTDASPRSGRERHREQRWEKEEERRKEWDGYNHENTGQKKRYRHRRHREGIPRHAVKTPPVVVRVKEQPVWPPTTIRSRYRVDILAPLYIDQLLKSREATNGTIPDKAAPGLEFYEGVQIAADSLKKAGFIIDIYVHDVTSSTDSARLLVSSGRLDSTDLIIGAVHATDVPVLADFARRKQINFVSALSNADSGEHANQYFTMLEPSLKTHCETIRDNIEKRFPGSKITVLYRNNTPAELNAYTLCTGDAMHPWSQGNTVQSLLCNTLPTREMLAHYIDTTQPFDSAHHTVIMVPVLDKAYADSLMDRLSDYFPHTQFVVYGMPTWNGAKFLRWNDLPNVEIDVTKTFHYDLASPGIHYVSSVCKKQFGRKATDYVYRGYEAMYWYASLLRQYGAIFNDNYNDTSSDPFTKFNVNLQYNDLKILYYENTNISTGAYQTGANKMD